MQTKECDISNNVKHIVFPKCCDSLNEKIKTSLDDTGKLLLVRVHLKNVLYNKTLAVGVLIFEGQDLISFKVKKLYTGCCYGMCKYHNIQTPTYYFVFPNKDHCSKKDFTIKVVKNYII
ncbi:hypothetical protein [Clostridium taeniosporum]|uniref:Uncharacterized protein n=1 Tax=Clostridium taeniosporum TaxID=394958 RepID=A0A1D7XK25_9CLOT|nr:hypothetical protein [Clostridium taeniosporum]AOR23693.1 hypothetical protein BGI42_08090 [Clostridium taeniosporum]